MPYKPSRERPKIEETGNALWTALEPFFLTQVSVNPLPRRQPHLNHRYIPTRIGDSKRRLKQLLNRLPEVLRNFRLGCQETEFLYFVLNDPTGNALALVGPRGAGKTSLLNYVDWVISDSGIDDPPAFLILDCRGMSETASQRDFVNMIVRACEEQASFFKGWQNAFATTISQDQAMQNAADPVEYLLRCAAHNSSSSGRRLWIIFDNLDQLALPTVREATELARRIHYGQAVQRRLGCIVSLRNSTRKALTTLGVTRALYASRLDISPPPVSALVQELGQILFRWAETDPVGQTCGHSAFDIQQAMQRFSELLQLGKFDINPLDALDEASAQDLRQTIILLKRILAHPDLPVDFLLGRSLSQEFYPLRAMIEGENHWYDEMAAKFVPNILSDEHADIPSFTLRQRILLLLNPSTDMSGSELLAMLKLLDFDEHAVDGAIRSLIGPLLIRCSPELGESVSLRNVSMHLTTAGGYYRQHLVRFPDYLLSVIFDVPLAHTEIRRAIGVGGPVPTNLSFSAKAMSLIEYAEEVRQEEESQIAILRKLSQKSDIDQQTLRRVRKIANDLYYDGLVSAALRDGFVSMIQRSRRSEVEPVREFVEKELTLACRTAEHFCIESKRLLRDVIRSNGDAQREKRTSAPREFRSGSNIIELQVERGGQTIEAEGAFAESSDSYFLILTRGRSNIATFLSNRGEEPSSKLHGSEPLTKVRGAVSVESIPGMVTLKDVSVALLPVTSGHRTAALVGDIMGDTLRLQILIPSRGLQTETYAAGESSTAELRELSKKWRRRISDLIVQNNMEALEEEIEVAGTQLASMALNALGQTVLASIASEVDTLLVVLPNNDLPVEWFRLDADYGRLIVGERFRVLRYPHRSASHGERGKWLWQLEAKPATSATLTTVGLGQPPKRFSEIQKLLSDRSALHLIGHQRQGVLELGDGDRILAIQPANVQAHPPNRASTIIISGCEVAQTEEIWNLASAFASFCKCEVWSPLTKITRRQAQDIDGHINTYLQRNGVLTFFDCVQKARKDHPVFRTYVCFAMSRDTKA